jgi:hypothetical protein
VKLLIASMNDAVLLISVMCRGLGWARIFAEIKLGSARVRYFPSRSGPARPVEREEKALTRYNLTHWHSAILRKVDIDRQFD